MTLALPDGVYVMLNVGFSLMLNVVHSFIQVFAQEQVIISTG